MTDKEIWSVWDEVVGVDVGIDPVPFALAILNAAPMQGADEPLTNHERIELYELRDAVSRLADAAQPVAIYQVIAGYGIGVYRDCSQEEYERVGENNPFRRIVYAARDAAPRDARDAVIEQCAKVCESQGRKSMTIDGNSFYIGVGQAAAAIRAMTTPRK